MKSHRTQALQSIQRPLSHWPVKRKKESHCCKNNAAYIQFDKDHVDYPEAIGNIFMGGLEPFGSNVCLGKEKH